MFPRTLHILIHELPDRIDEVPRDKFVITFCVSAFTGVMDYAYLRTKGYIEVKAMKGRLDQMAGAITPGRFHRLEP